MVPPPLADDQLVSRARVIALAEDQPCVVLMAPSGYGKSCTAAMLGARATGPTVMCRLTDADRSDGGVGRLLEALVAAYPQLGEQPPVVDGTGAARLESAFADLAGPATIVFDDVHLLDPLVMTALDLVVDDADSERRVVVATQGDPPGAVVAAVARGGAVVIGPNDLRFDVDECEALARIAGSPRSGRDIFEQTGGWPLAAGALVRSGAAISAPLVDRALAELSVTALDRFRGTAGLASYPSALIGDDGAGVELRRFAERHPALVEVDGSRWQVREVLRDALRSSPAPDEVLVDLADRLDRLDATDLGLVLLSRISGDRHLLQDRLGETGAALLDRGRFSLLRDLVAAVPVPDRWPTTLVVDAAAAFGLDQLTPSPDQTFRMDGAALERLADLVADDPDLCLAVAGLRTDFLRRRGDPAVVQVALEALEPVGPLSGEVSAGELVSGRSGLARRGLFQVLYGLGAAAQFAGDPAMVAEGGRLQRLAFDVADRSGADTVAIRAQSAYERVAIGLESCSAAATLLEVGASSLRAAGHPDAANLYVELADIRLRMAQLEAASMALAAASDWAQQSANHLVSSSIALVDGVVTARRDGPSEVNDRQLSSAWSELIASPRLRRAAPGFAIRIANLMVDLDDLARAEAWLERARALIGPEVQRGYAEEFDRIVSGRLERARRAGPPGPFPDVGNTLAAQPVGQWEYRLTLAWDWLRAGDPLPARAILEAPERELEPPWPERLAGAGADAASSDRRPVIRVLTPELRVELAGERTATPAGHAARLLTQLVVADGVITVDAVLDSLWPDADPASARNRFHQVLLRLRRGLGLAADGPITVVEGVVRLDRDAVTADLWDLRASAETRSERLRLLRTCEATVCSVQFAYDQALDDARWEVSRRLADLVTEVLDGDGVLDPEVRSVVLDLWDRLPDEDRIGLALADALDRCGQVDASEEIRIRIDRGT